MIDSLPWWDQPLSRNCAAMLEVAFRRQFSDPKLWLHTFATSPTAPVIIFHLMFHLHQPHPRVINGTRAYHRESAVDRWNRKKIAETKQQQKSFFPNHERKVCCFRVVRGGSKAGGVRKSKEKRHEPLVEFLFVMCEEAQHEAWVRVPAKLSEREREKHFIGKTFFLMPLFILASLAPTQEQWLAWSELRGWLDWLDGKKKAKNPVSHSGTFRRVGWAELFGILLRLCYLLSTIFRGRYESEEGWVEGRSSFTCVRVHFCHRFNHHDKVPCKPFPRTTSRESQTRIHFISTRNLDAAFCVDDMAMSRWNPRLLPV